MHNHRAIPVEVIREGKLYLNPKVGFHLQEDDKLVVIALEQPQV